jgi:hypothetical protein
MPEPARIFRNRASTSLGNSLQNGRSKLGYYRPEMVKFHFLSFCPWHSRGVSSNFGNSSPRK